MRTDIKWTAELKSRLRRGERLELNETEVVRTIYRPFVSEWYYFDRGLTKRVFKIPACQPSGAENNCYILFPADGSTKRVDFTTFATNLIPDLNFFTPDPAHAVVLYRYDALGNRVDNITDWALKQFGERYKGAPSPQPSHPQGDSLKVAEGRGGKSKAKPKPKPITKQAIFHYVYAVLHDPVYRETYAQNLKREFPRIPFYEDFWQWAAWGEQLMALHLGYETIAPWPLVRTDIPDEKARLNGGSPKAMLKANRDIGRIALDSETSLTGIPPEAWTYKLGNRSALEWILDQYKEKKPKDPTIRAKFDTYRFADYKDHVIGLLARVTRVSVETQAIVTAMREATR